MARFTDKRNDPKLQIEKLKITLRITFADLEMNQSNQNNKYPPKLRRRKPSSDIPVFTVKYLKSSYI